MPSLFDPIVPPEKFHPAFRTVRHFPGNEPTRLALDIVFEAFEDSDGNFIEQFQTTGFDSRTFELFLFAYFTDAGCRVTRPKERPDFLLEKDGLMVAVEATTSNPTVSKAAGVPVSGSKPTRDETKRTEGVTDTEQRQTLDRPHPTELGLAPPTAEEIAAHRARMEHELPIKLGSALYSKLQKRYWELPVVRDRPFVIAVEAFHAADSLFFSSAGLAEYLYGVEQEWEHAEDGTLIVTNKRRSTHRVGAKEIPSHFFAQPDTEHVSAVLFTNSGTTAKFTRMGYQAGLHRGNLLVVHSGFWPDPDPNSAVPRQLSFNLDDSPYEEWWGDGITVFHNPDAKQPLPHDFFEGANQVYREGDHILADGSAWSPYISRTLTVTFDDDTFAGVDQQQSGVGTILASEFDELQPARDPAAFAFVREVTWFATADRALIGVVFEDRQDKDYGWAILGRDLSGRFRAIDTDSGLSAPSDARRAVRAKLIEISALKENVFPQGDEE